MQIGDTCDLFLKHLLKKKKKNSPKQWAILGKNENSKYYRMRMQGDAKEKEATTQMWSSCAKHIINQWLEKQH